jgi:hypothetical protein
MKELVAACLNEEESDEEDEKNLTDGKKGFDYLCVDYFFYFDCIYCLLSGSKIIGVI